MTTAFVILSFILNGVLGTLVGIPRLRAWQKAREDRRLGALPKIDPLKSSLTPIRHESIDVVAGPLRSGSCTYYTRKGTQHPDPFLAVHFKHAGICDGQRMPEDSYFVLPTQAVVAGPEFRAGYDVAMVARGVRQVGGTTRASWIAGPAYDAPQMSTADLDRLAAEYELGVSITESESRAKAREEALVANT